MDSLANMVFSNWHFRRWLGLFFGIFFAVQAIVQNDLLLGFFSFFFLFQTITNSGCFGAKGCAVQINEEDNKASGLGEIEFKEVK